MTYGFFPGCSHRSEAGYLESVLAINRCLGLELVEIRDWNCCGATALFSQDETRALLLAGRLQALAAVQGLGQIATTCNACYTTLRKASQILSHDSTALALINRNLAREHLRIETLLPIRHYLELLVHDVPEELWQAKRRNVFPQVGVASYYGCQLTRPWQDLDSPERPYLLDRLLQKLGFRVVDHSAKTLCCGASHFFSYERQCRPWTSRIVTEMRRKGAQLISTLCPLCQMNLESAQDRHTPQPLAVPYFTQLVGLALGCDPRELGLERLLIPLTPYIGDPHVYEPA